jgi:4-amino-4-deoxy-L-arabinose transferase-like glycosyltransferase
MDQIKEIHPNQLVSPITQAVETVWVRVKDLALSDQQGPRRKGCHHLLAAGQGLLQGVIFLSKPVQGFAQFGGLILSVFYQAHDNQVNGER